MHSKRYKRPVREAVHTKTNSWFPFLSRFFCKGRDTNGWFLSCAQLRKEPLKEKGSTQKPTFFFFPFEAFFLCPLSKILPLKEKGQLHPFSFEGSFEGSVPSLVWYPMRRRDTCILSEGGIPSKEPSSKETKRGAAKGTLKKNREGGSILLVSFVRILCAFSLTGPLKEPLKEKGSTQKPTFFFFPFEKALTGK